MKGAELIDSSGFERRADGPPGAGKQPAPGEWKKVKERFGPNGQKYQKQETGRRRGEAYVANGVRFDGFRASPRALIEAKGPGYLRFIKDGKFVSWFRGKKKLLIQADRQFRAANGIPIEWRVAEKELATLLRKLFKDEGFGAIKVVYSPLVP